LEVNPDPQHLLSLSRRLDRIAATLAAIKHLLRCQFDKEIESAQLVLDASLIYENTETQTP
jgi:hypothetical protein